jgi:hypothetical protein
VSCGLLTSHAFALPSLIIKRKSDSGSLFVGQNQLIGGLACVVEAQKIVSRVLGNGLDTLALGLLNYANNVEFWIGFQAEDVPLRLCHD